MKSDKKNISKRKKKEEPLILIDKEPNREIDKEYKIRSVDNSTRIISAISIITFLIGLTVFSYGFSIIDGELGTTESKTFTISRSLGKGNKPGIIIFVTLAFLYLLYLVRLRGPQKYLKTRYGLLIVAYGLLLSLLWLTPWYNESLHYGLATIIFLSILIYNIMTYYLLYQNYQKNKKLFYFLIGLNIAVTIGLGVFAILHSNLDKDLFASFELIFAFLFGISILVLGFY
mgnify:FL=1|tara:strand:+ start:48 stop:737 length:690 start_codon:yes stop_codon:yes gene_type:complete